MSKQIISGIEVEIAGEQPKGCNVLFYSIKPVGNPKMGDFRKAVKEAYRSNSVKIMRNPTLEQILAIAQTVTNAGFTCMVKGEWGFYAF